MSRDVTWRCCQGDGVGARDAAHQSSGGHVRAHRLPVRRAATARLWRRFGHYHGGGSGWGGRIAGARLRHRADGQHQQHHDLARLHGGGRSHGRIHQVRHRRRRQLTLHMQLLNYGAAKKTKLRRKGKGWTRREGRQVTVVIAILNGWLDFLVN